MEQKKQKIDSNLYKDFVDNVYNKNNNKNLYDAMKDEIRRLFIEFSEIGGDVDIINKEAESYTEVVMALIVETRYEW